MRNREENKKLYVAILAAGQSKRMNSKISKVLHLLAGRPLLSYGIDIAQSLNPDEIFVVVGGPHKNSVIERFKDAGVTFVEQAEPRGTGDAVMTVKDYVDPNSDLFVIPGDAPLLKKETARSLVDFHRGRGAIATVLTTEHPEPHGYGRIIRSVGDRIMMIVEEADAFPEEKAIKEINSGFYVFESEWLFKWLAEIRPDNRQKEYYLTDVIEILQRRIGGVYAYKIEDWRETIGVNTRKDLASAERIMQERIINCWTKKGVTFVRPEQVYVEYDVEIQEDTLIYPFVALLGKTRIGHDAVIGPGVILKDEEIKPGEVIWQKK